MSNRTGTLPQSTLRFGSLTLGSAAGRFVAFSNTSTCVLNAIAINFTATATVGNRQIFFQVSDSSALIIWQCAATAAITAGQVVRLVAGSGITPVSNTVPLMQTMQLPVEFTIPTLSAVSIVDAANVDANDSFSFNATLVF
ncbi:MAG TPA: hypothetical protein VKB67_02005 [Rhizomicrobium sp.]|nr:hypothetical protein [Rhizomicrobium sp.]